MAFLLVEVSVVCLRIQFKVKRFPSYNSFGVRIAQKSAVLSAGPAFLINYRIAHTAFAAHHEAFVPS